MRRGFFHFRVGNGDGDAGSGVGLPLPGVPARSLAPVQGRRCPGSPLAACYALLRTRGQGATQASTALAAWRFSLRRDMPKPASTKPRTFRWRKTRWCGDRAQAGHGWPALACWSHGRRNQAMRTIPAPPRLPSKPGDSGAFSGRGLQWGGPIVIIPLLLRGGAVWQLVGLITRRSQVQILPPLPCLAVPFSRRHREGGNRKAWACNGTCSGRCTDSSIIGWEARVGLPSDTGPDRALCRFRARESRVLP